MQSAVFQTSSSVEPQRVERIPIPTACDPVVLVARSGIVRDGVADALFAERVVVDVVDPLHPSTRKRHTRKGIRSTESDGQKRLTQYESYIVVVNAVSRTRRRDLFGWCARADERAEEARLADAVAEASMPMEACRILVLCDVGEGARVGDARRWTRDVARRLRYEAEISGTSVDSVFYLLIDSATSVTEAARETVDWYFGRPTHPIADRI